MGIFLKGLAFLRRFPSWCVFFAGGVSFLAFEPFGFWVFAFFCPFVLVWVLSSSDVSLKRSVWLGWLFGVGFFGFGVSWVHVSIHQFGHAPLPLSFLLTALFVLGLALFFIPVAFLFKFLSFQKFPMFSVVVFPSVWVLGEVLRGFLFTGFPWLFLGFSQVGGVLHGFLPVFGSFGVSWLVVFCSAVLWQLGLEPRRLVLWGVLGGVLVCGFGLRFVEWTEPVGDAVPVALVQPSIPQEQKWDPRFFEGIFEQYHALNRRVGPGRLVVWPETALPLVYEQDPAYFSDLSDSMRSRGSSLVLGVVSQADDSGRYFNGVLMLGEGSGVYYKQRLVPFGEYVPFESWLRGVIAFFDLPMSSFVPGSSGQSVLFARVGGEVVSIAPFVCYEVAFSHLVRALAPVADVLLTVSNDAWFGRSFGPDQHLQIAQVRAVEVGRFLLRGTNTGFTAIVNPRGEVVKQLPQFEVGVLSGEVFRYQGVTPFLVWGEWPVWGLCFLVFGVGGFLVFRCRWV